MESTADGTDSTGRAVRPATATWRVELLGQVQATGRGGRLTRWPSKAAAALLARLAMLPGREHPREELIELLWPGVALETGRNRLRQALSVLRSLLETAGPQFEAVLSADRRVIRVLPGALQCDALEFEQAVRQGQVAPAVALYRGELMPGFYEDWIVEERGRLAALRERLDEPSDGLMTPGERRALRLEPSSATVAPSAAVGAVRLASTLPLYWTRAFGLDRPVAEVSEAVFGRRLVTLVGPGGNGKTRLAVATARALSETPAPPFGLVAFAGLLQCTDTDSLWNSLAHVMGAAGRVGARDAVLKALDGQRALLVLDNLEQLDEGAVQAIGELLSGCAQLHLLCTSRRRLGLGGERVIDLAGLPLPDLTTPPESHVLDDSRLVTVAESPAVALFVDRARDSLPAFRLVPANAAAVAGLVQLLAGMPLAIELAASRLRALSPRELLSRLAHDGGSPQLDLLARPATRGSQRARHASMRHVVTWSWSQLDAEVADQLRALAALPLAAPVELAAQAWLGLQVCEQPGVAVPDAGGLEGRVQTQLADAAEASLVTPGLASDGAGTATRYGLLPPVREYAAELTTPEASAAARAQWRRWLVRAAARWNQDGVASLPQVEALLDHVHAAIVTSLADATYEPGATHDAACLAASLRRHWEVDARSPPPRAVYQALMSLQSTTADLALRCELSLLLAFSAQHIGTSAEGETLARTALALATDDRTRAQALMRLALVDLWAGGTSPDIDSRLAEAWKLAHAAGDLETECLILRSQFLLATNRDGDNVTALKLAERTQVLWERLGHRRNASMAVMDQASCWLELGQTERAFDALVGCEQVCRDERFPTGYITTSWQLGRAAMKLRRAEAALGAFCRCTRDAWQLQRMTYVADALVQVPGGLALCGRHEDAARLQGFAVAHWQRQVGPLYRSLERDVTLTRRWLRQVLGAERLQRLHAEGMAMALPDAVALALQDGADPTGA